ncbi:hypothetical protein ZWY2020_011101 [Hordeum vulgare]|nr:hypothetical protein ZWY2020_011101 [Hordeum vulgare]
MGELMNTITRYAESDDTKDAGEDDDNMSTARRGELSKVSNYRSKSLMIEVVKIKSPYHPLFGRPAYARFMACRCYAYLKLKMPSPKGPITISGERKIAQECEEGSAAYAETACAAEELKFHQANVDPTDMTALKRPTIDVEPPFKFKPMDDTKVIDFTPGDSTKQFTIGTGLDPKLESVLIEFICESRDIFAWKPSDMPGVPKEFAEHHLNTDPKVKPVRQYLRRFNEERRKAIGEEVA